MLTRVLLVFVVLLPLQMVAANQFKGPNQFNQLFTYSSKPPRGFENLAKNQKIGVDVYYLNQFIGVELMNVSTNEVQFLHPAALLEKLGAFNHQEELIKVLQNPLNAHSDLVCFSEQQEHCNRLNPKITGVIYDPLTFRVYLFINPHYLKNKLNTQWLEPSTAGLSYQNNISMAADSGNQNLPFANWFNAIRNTPLYNLTSDNILAYQQTRLNVSASYANQPNFNNVLDRDTGQLNSANIVHVYKNYEYKVGLIEMPSTIFFASNAILGGEIKTTLDTLKDKSFFLSTPLTLFLPVTSTVSLIQGSKIIYSAKLPAGNQIIDTSTFPQGSYPVTVRITDAQGVSTLMTKIVTNSVLLPPPQMPQNYFSLGYLMGIRQLNSNVYDSLLPIPVYQAGTNYRLQKNLSLMVKVLGSNKAAFLNPGINVLSNNFIIQPGILLSTNQRYGYTTAINWQKNQWSANYTISQVLYANNQENVAQNNFCFKDNPTSCALNLINQGIFYSSASLSYGFNFGSMGIFASQSNYYQSQKLYTYGVNYLTALYRTNSGSWQLNLNATRLQNETNIFAVVSYQFSDANKSGNLGLGYGHFQTNYPASEAYLNDASTKTSGNGITTQGNLIWHKTDDTNYGYTVGLQGNTDPINQTIGGTYDLSKPQFHVNSYITNYSDNKGNYAQFGGILNSRYAWAQQKTTIGNGNLDENSGIIVRVDAKKSRSTFNVYADNRIVSHIHANRNYFIKLDAYKTWLISVTDSSGTLFHLDKSNRIVTLYPGNVQTLIWHASSALAVGGRLVNQHDEPVANAILSGGVGFAMTDEHGYFQINLLEHTKQLISQSSTERCVAKIPHLDFRKTSAYLNKVTCRPLINQELH